LRLGKKEKRETKAVPIGQGSKGIGTFSRLNKELPATGKVSRKGGGSRIRLKETFLSSPEGCRQSLVYRRKKDCQQVGKGKETRMPRGYKEGNQST